MQTVVGIMLISLGAFGSSLFPEKLLLIEIVPFSLKISVCLRKRIVFYENRT